MSRKSLWQLASFLKAACHTPFSSNPSASGQLVPAQRRFLTLWRPGRDTGGYQHFDGRGSGSSFALSTRAKYILGATAVGGGVYYISHIEEVPYTHRRHAILFVSPSSEKMMGQMLFNDQKATAMAQGNLLPPHHPATQRVRRLGLAIAQVAQDGAGGGKYDHMKGLDWEFAVIRNPQPNAFVVPGGKVVVYTGLLTLLDRSDNELAAVLAHEVSHVLARHPAERISTLNLFAIADMVVRLTLGFGIPTIAMYMGVFLPYSRLAEYEADEIGLKLMAKACFDPVGAPSMLAKLAAKEKELQAQGLAMSMPAFLRTHPLTEERVKRVKKELPEAYKVMHQSSCDEIITGFILGGDVFKLLQDQL